MSLLDRAALFLRAQPRARDFGIPFLLRRSFEIPQRLAVNGEWILLQHPNEHGVRIDFIGAFIDDAYGLRRIAPYQEVRTIVDIGANCGWFSIAARSFFPAATIHAYEPNPRITPFLRHNVAALGVEVFPEAVGGQRGLVHLEGDLEESNQTRVAPGGEIRCTSIHEVLERIGGADLIKMDCEGAEWPILEAAKFPTTRFLTLEYHLWAKAGAAHADAAGLVESKGFCVVSQSEGPDFGLIFSQKRKRPRPSWSRCNGASASV